ncbi:MAG TPA: phage tail sheath subtilisin-like domain-containing protein [Candidatus Angelobacter sp.]|nr:phage tail sheath subtilisin-like domain-containing protein [Candidatus Angelobacter sp.]
MPTSLAPGVYIEELPTLPAIAGVPTSVAGFIGVSERGPAPALLSSLVEFRQAYPHASQFLALAVEGFFGNGGTRCYAATIAPSDPLKMALDALTAVKLQVLCCPDESIVPQAASLLAAHCEQMKDRFCILQSPQPVIPDATHNVPVQSAYSAYYYPWLSVLSNGGSVTIPPGGHVAGVYARIDTQHGVHTFPAGTDATLTGVTGLSANISPAQDELLFLKGISTIRSFPGQGTMVWGTRTTSQDGEWLYIAVRRFIIFVEQSLQAGLQGAVFETNGPTLWMSIRGTIANFLRSQWAAGTLIGARPDQAFSVRCDNTTMTQADIDAGRVIIQVGLAPHKPGEFVHLKITVQLNPHP